MSFELSCVRSRVSSRDVEHELERSVAIAGRQWLAESDGSWSLTVDDVSGESVVFAGDIRCSCGARFGDEEAAIAHLEAVGDE